MAHSAGLKLPMHLLTRAHGLVTVRIAALRCAALSWEGERESSVMALPNQVLGFL